MGIEKPTLDNAYELLTKGQYNDALEMLDQLQKLEFKTVIDWMIWIIIKAQTLNRLDRFDESLSLLAEIKKKQLILLESKFRCDFFVSRAEANLFIGRLDEAQKDINSGEGVLRNADLHEKESTKFCAIVLQLIKGSLYFRKGFLEEASTLFIDCVEKSHSLGNMLTEAISYNQLGRVQLDSGNLEQSLEYFFLSLELRKKMGSLHEISRAYNNIGVIYMRQGDTKKALDYLQQSLALKENLGNFGDMSNILHNIGTYFFERGELARAEDYLNKSLRIRKKFGDSQKIADIYSRLGDVQFSYRNFDTAERNYLRSYELRKQLENKIDISFSLFELINLRITEGKIEEAEIHFAEFEDIKQFEDNLLISQHYDISRALIHYAKPRLKDRFMALELFTDFLSQKKTRNFLHIFSLLKVCDLLFFELKATGDEKILLEVQKYVGQLIDIANHSKSFPLLAEAYLLNSKLALLEYNVKEAQELLTLAFSIAEDKGLRNIALRISNEYDLLLDQLNQWNKYLTHNASIVERIELAQLDKIIKKMNKTTVEERTYFEDEEPVMFMIISESGNSIFTKHFSTESAVDDSLISAFLTAINQFIQDVFESVGIIERIKHHDYTILMKMQEKLFFCYIIRGKSYLAQNKIRTLLDRLLNNKELWIKIKSVSSSMQNFSHEDLQELELIIENTLAPKLSEIDIF